MKNIFKLIIIPLTLYAQEFQISNSGSNRFSIDTFSNNVYWQELSTGKIFITNMTTMETKEASFPSLPIFANKTHLAAYEHSEKLYLHDFDIGETRLILENVLAYPYFFSFSFL